MVHLSEHSVYNVDCTFNSDGAETVEKIRLKGAKGINSLLRKRNVFLEEKN